MDAHSQDGTNAGPSLRARREALGISQEQVSAKAGMASATVRSFEAGKKVRAATARKIVEALHELQREGTETEVVRELVEMDEREVADYLLDLPDELADRIMARYHAERARRSQQRSRRIGER